MDVNDFKNEGIRKLRGSEQGIYAGVVNNSSILFSNVEILFLRNSN